jgi:hypothetical protein
MPKGKDFIGFQASSQGGVGKLDEVDFGVHMAAVYGPGFATAHQYAAGQWVVITKERFNGKYPSGYYNNSWGPSDFGSDGALLDFEWIYSEDKTKLLEWRFLGQQTLSPGTSGTLLPASPAPGLGAVNVGAGDLVSVAVGDVSTNVVNVTGANVVTSTSATTVGLAGLSASATISGGTTGAVSWNTVNAAVGTSGTNTGMGMPFLLTIPYTVAFIEQSTLQLSSSALIPSAHATSYGLGSIGSTALTIPVTAPQIDFLAVRTLPAIVTDGSTVTAGNAVIASAGGSDPSASAITVGSIPSLTFPSIQAANWAGLSASATISGGTTAVTAGTDNSALMGLVVPNPAPRLKIFWEKPQELPIFGTSVKSLGFDWPKQDELPQDELPAFYYQPNTTQNLFYSKTASPLRAFRIEADTVKLTPGDTNKFDIFTFKEGYYGHGHTVSYTRNFYFREDLPNASGEEIKNPNIVLSPAPQDQVQAHYIIPIKNDSTTLIKLETTPYYDEFSSILRNALSVFDIGIGGNLDPPKPYITQAVIQRNPGYGYDMKGTTGPETLSSNGNGNFFWGDGGKDTLTGGNGMDVFAFRYGDSIYADLGNDGTPDDHIDVINNFDPGTDKILVFAPDLKHVNGPDDFALGLQITPRRISHITSEKDRKLEALITEEIVTGLEKDQALLLEASDGNFIILPSPIQKDYLGVYRDPYGLSYLNNDPGAKHLNPLVIKLEGLSGSAFTTPSDYFL